MAFLGAQPVFWVRHQAEPWGRQAAAPGREAARSTLLWQQFMQVHDTTCSQALLAENTVCNIPLRRSGVEHSAPSSGSCPSIHSLESPH